MKLRQKSADISIFTVVLIIILIPLTATAAKLSDSSSASVKCDGSESKTKPTGTLEQGCTAITTQDLKTWSLQYEVSGGIAGLRRQLTLNSDTQLIAIDEKRNKRITQQATQEQITNLTTLLKSLKIPAASVAPSRLNSHCADCFQYRLTLTLNDQQQTINLDDSQLQQDSKYAKLINLLSSILNQTLSQ